MSASAEAAAVPHLPFHTQVLNSTFLTNIHLFRCLTSFRLILSLSFLRYRLLHPPPDDSRLWITALVCEIGLVLGWILAQPLKWLPVERQTHPDRLSARYDDGDNRTELPAVDIFVTTADPRREPPIITMNTVLSALAVDYPVEKVACYVSDDGGSWKTFWALVETARFAKAWLPFCRKFRIEPRAPKAYFRKSALEREGCSQTEDFVAGFQALKVKYDEFKLRLEQIMHTHNDVPRGVLSFFDGRKSEWPAKNVSDHPGIFKVLLDPDLDQDSEGHPVPYLVYVSREKRSDCKHHYKAGAMNSLARVSGIVTNSPFILNLDCDMYVNDSTALRHAMCFFMDPKLEDQICFVQFPQIFEGVDDDDVYSNRLKSVFEILLKGMDGVQGPCYIGTGCVHRRAALYGCPMERNSENGDPDVKIRGLQDQISFTCYEHLKKRFGHSTALAFSVWVSNRRATVNEADRPMLNVQEAMDVISCDYEERTEWGDKVGWIYGSCTEDILTGLTEHCRGWRSIYCTPSRPTFLGCAPMNGPDALTWRKRAAVGLTEIFLGKHCPLICGSHGLSFLQRICYIWVCSWNMFSVFLFTYAILPAVCLLRGRSLTPKISDPSFLLFALVFIFSYATNFIENRLIDVGPKAWWNGERMEAITNSSSSLLGVFEVLMKLLGRSETVFVVTPKQAAAEEVQEEPQERASASPPLSHRVSSSSASGASTAALSCSSSCKGSFGFNASPLFIFPTALVIVNLIGLSVGMVRVVCRGAEAMDELGGGLWCAMWVVVLLQSIAKGLWMCSRGEKEGGIPSATIAKATMLALFFCFMALFLS